MTLEDRLQGEWLCCVDDQCVDEAWSVDIRGNQCTFEGITGTLFFRDDVATLVFGDGDRIVINRPWLTNSPNEGDIPVVIESDRGVLQSGWMFRVAASTERVTSDEENDADY